MSLSVHRLGHTCGHLESHNASEERKVCLCPEIQTSFATLVEAVCVVKIRQLDSVVS